ncbi:MAG: NgoMIV family type II restriction endonuclease [Armatimonadota bacterium]
MVSYHAALYELTEAIDESGREDQAELLHNLIDGNRLRDISDLPFDLAI